MATLTADSPRTMYPVLPDATVFYPAVADDVVYAGALVGSSSGNARPLAAGDDFMGVARFRADNAGGAAGDEDVEVITRGVLVGVAVAGASPAVGDAVYASDDDTLTKTSTSNSEIGKIIRIGADGLHDVRFGSVAY
jgi:hypothetical protein